MAKKRKIQVNNDLPDLTFGVILVKELKWIFLTLSLFILAIKSLLILWVS